MGILSGFGSIKSVLTGIVNGPYQYRAGPRDIGVGVENLALVRDGAPMAATFMSPRYNVQRSMNLGFPTVPNRGQELPSYDLRANGVYLSGDIELAALTEQYYAEREG